ncbi:MAG: AmmeMemoRadiSam system protein B [Deltaproteobacteria bacterium]|nr:AmmeMemoRadiSam system protein B [Deltaproteobacteria bacterium]
MEIRRRGLPAGWYPDSAEACRQEIEQFQDSFNKPVLEETEIYGGVIPHAGWYFSGKLASMVFHAASRKSQPDIVAVMGGHLGSGPGLLYFDQGWETPLGVIEIDQDLSQAFKESSNLKIEGPEVLDNTVEIQLPMIKYFFPESRLVAARAPHAQSAITMGRDLAELARDQGKTIKIFGSTDLTHYGPNYGFSPQGSGDQALDWVRRENDKGFINAVLSMDETALLDHAAGNHSACSAGAAAAAMAACQTLGSRRVHLLDYYTSADIMRNDSFVGYAGFVFS